MKTSSYTEEIIVKNYAFNKAPRCGAKVKNNNGWPCRCPAVRGKNRCRVHGGARGSGARRGNVNALKQGFTTSGIKKFRQMVKIVICQSAELLLEVD